MISHSESISSSSQLRGTLSLISQGSTKHIINDKTHTLLLQSSKSPFLTQEGQANGLTSPTAWLPVNCHYWQCKCTQSLTRWPEQLFLVQISFSTIENSKILFWKVDFSNVKEHYRIKTYIHIVTVTLVCQRSVSVCNTVLAHNLATPPHQGHQYKSVLTNQVLDYFYVCRHM